MMWQVRCEGYEVRSVPEVRTNKQGGEYVIMRLENPQGYSDNITSRDVATFRALELHKGDVINFDAVASFGKYPRIFIPEDAAIEVVS